MAGKPEHIQHHQHQPSVQNVVVYVSNDNFTAQAYAVNQQNVNASYPQQNSTTSVTFASSTQPVAPASLATPIKNIKPPVIKTQDFSPNNGLISNISLPQQAETGFYASTNTPGGLVQTNGFHHGQNITYGKQCEVNEQQPCNGYSQRVAAQTFYTGPEQKGSGQNENNFGDAANIVAVMGGEAGTAGTPTPSGGSVVFPRCDSVRSETAESSCSSLSSADSQSDASANALTLLLPPSAAPPSHQPVMLNSVNVQQRNPSGAISLSQQQLGNIVLAMAVPPNSNNVNQPVPVQPVVPTITVPYGWKRLNINGSIVYISPSNTALSSLEHLKEYLQTQGTCKCGLECPLKCDTVFNFDPKVATRPWVMPPSDSNLDLTKLCNHKRKLMAMATLALNSQNSGDSKAKKDGRVVGRKRRKVSGGAGGTFPGASVSQLLAQRERGKDPTARALQGWNSTSQHLATAGPQFPQDPNASTQFLRYAAPGSGVTPAIMVHQNTSQHQCGSPGMVHRAGHDEKQTNQHQQHHHQQQQQLQHQQQQILQQQQQQIQQQQHLQQQQQQAQQHQQLLQQQQHQQHAMFSGQGQSPQELHMLRMHQQQQQFYGQQQQQQYQVSQDQNKMMMHQQARQAQFAGSGTWGQLQHHHHQIASASPGNSSPAVGGLMMSGTSAGSGGIIMPSGATGTMMVSNTPNNSMVMSGNAAHNTSNSNSGTGGMLVQGSSPANGQGGMMVQGGHAQANAPAGMMVQSSASGNAPSGLMLQGHMQSNTQSGMMVQSPAPTGMMLQSHSQGNSSSGMMMQGPTQGNASSGMMVQGHPANSAPAGMMVQGHPPNSAPSGLMVQTSATSNAPSGMVLQNSASNNGPSGMVQGSTPNNSLHGMMVQGSTPNNSSSGMMVHGSSPNNPQSAMMVQGSSPNNPQSGMVVQGPSSSSAPSGIMVQGPSSSSTPSGMMLQGQSTSSAPSRMMVQGPSSSSAPSGMMMQGSVPNNSSEIMMHGSTSNSAQSGMMVQGPLSSSAPSGNMAQGSAPNEMLMHGSLPNNASGGMMAQGPSTGNAPNGMLVQGSTPNNSTEMLVHGSTSNNTPSGMMTQGPSSGNAPNGMAAQRPSSSNAPSGMLVQGSGPNNSNEMLVHGSAPNNTPGGMIMQGPSSSNTSSGMMAQGPSSSNASSEMMIHGSANNLPTGMMAQGSTSGMLVPCSTPNNAPSGMFIPCSTPNNATGGMFIPCSAPNGMGGMLVPCSTPNNSTGGMMVPCSTPNNATGGLIMQCSTPNNTQSGMMVAASSNVPAGMMVPCSVTNAMIASSIANSNIGMMVSGANTTLAANSSILMHPQRAPPWQQQNRTNVMHQHHHSPVVMPTPQPNVLPTVSSYERVPPLHHHTPPPPVWTEEVSRKKTKGSGKAGAAARKQRSFEQHRVSMGGPSPVDSHVPCPNIDVRQIPVEHNRPPPGDVGVPSFMEDPSGYLAQQTALLNSTISRQTGVGAPNFMCHSPVRNQDQQVQSPTSCSSPATVGVPLPSNVLMPNSKATPGFPARSNSNIPSANTSSYSQTQMGTPDSSQCQACVVSSESVLYHQMQHYENREENPVTSSTLDRLGNQRHQIIDSRGPIQGGTVSTSNGSPVETFTLPQPESSPTSSTPTTSHSGRIPDTCSTSNSVYISSASSSSSPFSYQRRAADYCHHVLEQQGQTMVTTMASGHTVSSNTITSVLAGKANTATVSVGNSTSSTPPTSMMPPVPSQPQPPITTVSKSPLEMVQSVVSSIQVPPQQQEQHQQATTAILKQQPGAPGLPPGHILVSSGGQLIMANPAGNAGIMPPPQPPPPHSMAKIVSHSSMPPISVSPMVTSVTGAVTQVIPAVGVAQQVLGQPTVLVNALPAPLLIQPGVMTVDGMTGLNQNAMQIPHLAVATGNVIHHSPNNANSGLGQILDSMNQDHAGTRNAQNASGYVRHAQQQPSLLSPPEMQHHAVSAPGTGKKKGSKKRKVSPQTVASMLLQQNSPTASIMMQQQQQQQNFSQQSFGHQSIATTGPMLQALTIVPGKAGTPAQILMNGQPGATAGHFGTQQLIAAPTTSQPPQQINLLLNSVPTFQQFIVPSLGGMVMATDGTTTLLPADTTNLGVQLQLQNVNGQNVLTPVQSHGGTTVFGHHTGQSILTAGPAGMVIRTPTGSGKIQQQNTGAPQFLASSPNGGQFLMNGTATFSGQLSPLVANVSPNQQMSFTTNTSPVRPSGNTQQPQQEFIQCGQVMVPCSASNAQNHQNTTVVQQNTTIVQQQTTMVSNNQPDNGNTVASATTLNVNQHNFISTQCMTDSKSPTSPQPSRKHSVSTQTAVNQSVQATSSPSVTPGTLVVTASSGGSPPDTTTHSPIDPGSGGSLDGRAQTPSADTTTHSVGVGSTDDGLPSPCPVTGSCGDGSQSRQHTPGGMPMVHCVSSSNEQDEWGTGRYSGGAPDYSGKYIGSLGNVYIECGGKQQEAVVSSRQMFEYSSAREHKLCSGSKRKHSDALIVMETHPHDINSLEEDDEESVVAEGGSGGLSEGDLVWGAARGFPAWPGKLVGPVTDRDKVMVRWFGGDRALTEVPLQSLKTLSEGLEAHHRARKKFRKSRKLNSQLENAIQEAMLELDRMTEQQQQETPPPPSGTEVPARQRRSTHR